MDFPEYRRAVMRAVNKGGPPTPSGYETALILGLKRIDLDLYKYVVAETSGNTIYTTSALLRLIEKNWGGVPPHKQAPKDGS